MVKLPLSWPESIRVEAEQHPNARSDNQQKQSAQFECVLPSKLATIRATILTKPSTITDLRKGGVINSREIVATINA